MLWNTTQFGLISNRGVLSVLFSHGQSLTSVQRAAFIFTSRDVKTRQQPNKYSTSPGKRTYKPLLHTMGCKVPSPHQAQTTPWSHSSGTTALLNSHWHCCPCREFPKSKADSVWHQHCSTTTVTPMGYRCLLFCWLLQVSIPKQSMTIYEQPEQFSPALIFSKPADGFHCMLLL